MTKNQLGSVTDISALPWDVPYFVGVTVQGVELTPRTELTYAPYSFGTNKAQTVVCSGALGDVKYSILNPTQFATVNGDCWVPMDGRSMVESTLATKIGGSNVPNGSGLFLRNHEFNEGNDPSRTVATPIASIQDDDNKIHNHVGGTSLEGAHTHTHNANGGDYLGSAGITFMDGTITESTSDSGPNQINIRAHKALIIDNAGGHSHSFITTTSGGPETRPKNMDFYVYIRIN